MNPRELSIGLSLLVPTLIIGFWPKVATDLFENSTNALANILQSHTTIALIQLLQIS